ncbi:alpha/beta fold hydrolase [Actinokineospora bangkokensis]|uniref:alpha/beta fold hydrolase n=1 Tax=Actinokineospora bangkokensis TaxID=1193682 RepID=UPI0011783D3A|nr:alpha/beta fold hydrolase [Actinokineospora bangkokensis]
MDPILLLHPFPLDARVWDPLRARLSAEAQLVDPHLPGWGGTALPDADPSLDAVAEHVLRVLDGRGLDRVTAVGAALGGFVLMALLRRAPERVAAAVFTGTQAIADPDRALATRAMVIRRATEEGTGWLADFMLPQLLTAEDPALRRVIDEQSPRTVAWYAAAMAARPDSRPLLRALDLDALVVHGAEDPIMGAPVAEELAELTGAPLHFVEGAAHLPAYEQPDRFLDVVLPWLRARPAAAT